MCAISDDPSQPRQPDALVRAHSQRREETVGQVLFPAQVLGDDVQQGYEHEHRPEQGQAAVASRQ